MKHADVIIAGAGIIGVSLALELRRRGADVLVVERGQPGQEASSAAAGMLAASDPETPPALRALARASARMFPEYVANMEGAAGMRVDFHRNGAIALLHGSDVPAAYHKLSRDEITQMEPALHAQDHSAFFVEEDWVDPALLMPASVRAAEHQRIEIRRNVGVVAFAHTGSHVEVRTTAGALEATTAVDCRGAWSGAPVRPRKGQSLYVKPTNPTLLTHVIAAPDVYLVPRCSGRILIGATVEDVGYDTSVDPAVIQRLHHAACQLVPQLAAAPVVSTWAGLRPGTPDDLPLIGTTATPGLFLATGHFRNGILLAPVTAYVVADLVAGTSPAHDLSAFSPLRFAEFRT